MKRNNFENYCDNIVENVKLTIIDHISTRLSERGNKPFKFSNDMVHLRVGGDCKLIHVINKVDTSSFIVVEVAMENDKGEIILADMLNMEYGECREILEYINNLK